MSTGALEEIIKFFGGSAILIAAAAWLTRQLMGDLLARDLRKFAEDLKAKSARELESFRADLQQKRDVALQDAEAASGKNERIRAEILRWANPILGIVGDLKHRLDNILKDAGYLALQQSPATPLPANWSVSYDYMLPSTLYLFCHYFYWVRRLQEELSFELFESHADKDAFLVKLRAVGDALGTWPLPKEPRMCTGTDVQVFKMQQRLLGEAGTVRGEGSRCLGYDEFLELWEEPPLADYLGPLRRLLDGLDDPTSCRWQRLELVSSAIAGLENHCQQILQVQPVNSTATALPPATPAHS